MNDIVDELREKNEDRFGSVELPDIEQLVEVSEQIFLPLPKEFKEYLLSVSDVLFGSIEPVTASDPNLHTYLPEVCANAWDLGVPRTHIPICEIPQGYYIVAPEGEVSFWRFFDMDDKQAGGELVDDLEWDSVWFWVEDVWLNGNLKTEG